MSNFVKDPDEVLDFGIRWGDYLAGNELDPADTVVTSTILPVTGIAVDSSSYDAASQTAAVWLSGGTTGVNYSITNRVVTQGGRTYDRTLVVLVRSK